MWLKFGSSSLGTAEENVCFDWTMCKGADESVDWRTWAGVGSDMTVNVERRECENASRGSVYVSRGRVVSSYVAICIHGGTSRPGNKK